MRMESDFKPINKELDFGDEEDVGNTEFMEDALFPVGSHVEVYMHPPKDKGSRKSGGKTARWVEAQIMEHDRDSSGETTYVCYIPLDYDGNVARRTQVYPRESVRMSASYQPYEPVKTEKTTAESKESGKLTGSETPAKTMQDFMARRKDAIANGYDPDSWEPGIVIWQLRQCSKAAESLNGSLYSLVAASITDSHLKLQLTQRCEGDLVRLMLNCRKRFGNNAGVLHIQNAATYGTLRPFSELGNMYDDLESWTSYHIETDPHVHRLALALHRVEEMITKQRLE